MKKFMVSIIIFMFGLTIFSCSTNKAQIGAVLGGLGGAAVGGQVGKKKHRRKNALIGALIGVTLGYMIGNELDKYDLQKINNTLETSKSYQTTSWINPDTGKQVECTPEPAYVQGDKVCRKVRIKVLSQQIKQVYAIACRQPDGTWKLKQN